MVMAKRSIKAVVLLFLHFNVRASRLEPRVYGGNSASIEKFPHSVYMTAECSQKAWICGASVLNQRILLTAGHCVYGCVGKYSIRAYAGHDVIGEMKIMRKVSKYLVHREYEPVQCKNDIALGFVAPDLLLEKLVQRVIIMRSFSEGAEAKVAGWGMDETNFNSNQLKWVTQRLQSKKNCKPLGKLSKGMMCATNAFDTYPSHGDSGSALVLSNLPVQIGLVSFKEATIPHLIAYTNISYYYSWIHEYAKKLNCG